MADMKNALVQAAKGNKELALLLASVMASKPRRGTKRTKKARPSVDKSPEATAQRKTEFAAAAIVAATERGFENVIPNETLLTFGKWEEKGFTVKKGEKSIRVKTRGMRGKGIPLFHKDQVEASAAEATA